MAEREVKLSIIILSYNTKELLKKCLESVICDQWSVVDEQPLVVVGKKIKKLVTSHQSPVTEIIVVDNGSTDGSVEYLRQLAGWRVNGCDSEKKLVNSLTRNKITVKFIENKENLGFSKGNNQGIKMARGEYIMLLNSDTIVKKGAIEKLINFLDKHPKISIIGPKLLNLDGSPQANCGRFPDLGVVAVMLFGEHWGISDYVRCSPKNSCLVDWLMGAAFIARRKVFEKIGGLDEKLFMYMEEVEWFYRARQAGFRAYFLKEAEIIHLGRGSAKHGKKEPILNIYRGLIHYYKKHKSKLSLFVLLLMLKAKAFLTLIIGYLKNDNYLKETYGEALKIN